MSRDDQTPGAAPWELRPRRSKRLMPRTLSVSQALGRTAADAIHLERKVDSLCGVETRVEARVVGFRC
jgi:hypothetical protein